MTMMMSTWKKRGVVRHRWRPAVTVAAALTFLLLTVGVLWSPVDVDSMTAPSPDASTDVEGLRRLLLRSVDDERGTWPCLNASSSCMLTPSLLATTSAARRSVYSRTGRDCLAMFHGHSDEIEAARKLTDTVQMGSAMLDEDLLALTANCAAFKQSRGYFTEPLSRVEAEFPIAFSILVYDNIPQVKCAHWLTAQCVR